MESEQVLVSSSLAETLWRLEEVRQGFRPKFTSKVQEALCWVISRQGLQRSYANLFSPTIKDIDGVQLLTGEHVEYAALRHILGEEALRTVLLWGQGSSAAVNTAVNSFNQLLERGGASCASLTGFYCCYKCTPAFMRALAVVKPDGWRNILEKSVGNIKENRTSDGRWRSFPFFYTLLTLSEIDLVSAKDELRHARNVAEKLVKRYQKDDRTSRFRRLGLEAAISA